MDSGSCVDIAPSRFLRQFPTRPRSHADKKKKYIAANGSPIPCHGDKDIKFRTPDGSKHGWTFVAGEVNKILKSVSKTADQGNGLWFDAEGGFIIDLDDPVFAQKWKELIRMTKLKTPFRRIGDTYKLEAWVRRPTGTARNQQLFSRQAV